MNRYLPDVIDQLLEVIPETLIRESLIEDLRYIQYMTKSASPEVMPAKWRAVSERLSIEFGDKSMTEDWEKELVRIWAEGRQNG